MSVAANLDEVMKHIRAAERLANRPAGDVRLIAVSKTKPLELIDEAARAGQREFGENYVQEAVGKASARPEYTWHFIGSLQTNKVKDVVGRFQIIHSVDRLKLANEISKVAAQRGIVQDILLQVHIGEEESKHGVTPSEASSLVQDILKLPALRLRGLMSLPPLTESEATGRGYFRELRELAANLRQHVLSAEQVENFDMLSIGTSGDFEWAILEGATHVRIGTSIFGAREPRA